MSDADVLAARADRFQSAVLEVACGPGGLIVSFPRFDTRRPFQEGEDEAAYGAPFVAFWYNDWGDASPRPTLAEALYGEDTLWTTGLFLWSQMLRYRVTGEPEALATARKCFRDLNHIFRLCGAMEPGMLGKPYGGRGSVSWSYDQSALPVLPYAWFAQEFATPEERALAEANLRQHGELYLRRQWEIDAFGHRVSIVGSKHPSQMKLLACAYAAYRLTGETAFQRAVLDAMRRFIASGGLPWPANPCAVSHNLFYWAMLCDYWRTTELAAEADWDGCLREYWSAAQTALDEEGLIRFGLYDTVAHIFTPSPDRWMSREEGKAWFSEAPHAVETWWVSATNQWGRAFVSGAVAVLALLVRSRGLDARAGVQAQRALLRLDEESLRYAWDDGLLPAEMRPFADVFAPEHAAMWLLAYWMGRQQGAW